MSISDNTAKELSEAIKGIIKYSESIPESTKKVEPRIYKCNGEGCDFQTSDPDEYINHRMGDIYTKHLELEKTIKALKTPETPKLENPCPTCKVHELKAGTRHFGKTLYTCTDKDCDYNEQRED